jgi:hypothetical protein
MLKFKEVINGGIFLLIKMWSHYDIEEVLDIVQEKTLPKKLPIFIAEIP